MPDIRCKWYQSDGTPIRDGCPTRGCRFIHPSQKAWKFLPHKLSVRCMYYDSHGKPINGGCRASFRGCRFIHPDNPDWGVAEKPRTHLQRKSNSPAISRSTEPDNDQLTDSRVFRLLDSLKTGSVPVERRSPTLSGSLVATHMSKDSPSIAADVGAELKYVSNPIMPMPSVPSSQHSQVDPRRSSVPSEFTSALSKTTDVDVPRQTWKRRMFLLSQAHDLIQKLSEIERRTVLQSTALIQVTASPVEVNSEALKDLTRKDRDILEEKLNIVVTQLIEDDIWPLPNTTQSDFSVFERRQLELSAGVAELGRRLDVMVTQFNEIKEITKRHQGSMSLVPESEEQRMSRPSKKRRISANGSFQAPFNPQDILARLDILQSKAVELEAESLYDDRLLEVIDERLGGWLAEKHIARPVLPDSLNDVVQGLDVDLDILCGELADLETGGLGSQIETLRLETSSLKQTMESLTSDQQSLHQRQVDLGQQARKIMEELKELRILPQDTEIVTNTEKIVGEITLNVQKHIETETAPLYNTIKSYHEEIQNTVFAGLEPMVIKTETMFNYLRPQTNTS